MCLDCMRRTMLSRRAFVAGAAALGLAPALAPIPAAAQTTLTPDEALARLVAGNGRYAANTAANKDFSAGRAARAAGQAPFAAILGCSDSRVPPEIIFDQGPGELFIVRVAGNFVNDDGLASLEYCITGLGTPLVLVLGHSSCGAIAAAIKAVKEGATFAGHFPGLIDQLRPGVEQAVAANPPDLLAAAVRDNVRVNVAELIDAEPIVSEYVAAGKVKIAGGVYDIATGIVTLV